jgi:adenosylcobinamide amidohydrolase
MDAQLRMRREDGRDLPLLLWRFPSPMRTIASAPHGGGLGVRRWVVNAQVPTSYARRDPDHHLGKLGVSLGLRGKGVGLLTAVDVRRYRTAVDSGVEAWGTVSLGHAVQAAAPHDPAPVALVGTVNIVAVLPEPLSDAALVNVVATASEAKAQALHDLGLAATGTATDAIVVLCPPEGRPHDFGGPRSVWGARLARVVHDVVLGGARP